ncbi:hypothetical protein [Lentilactobacillus hilgardii]|uniref:Integral membrane protein n=1 Tax=Lentilactobacillus hilgardii (strain ATCC 8290 / DSM 20176 / CCUG 30140 / JCM 1155 / KCTC 3500 / NBRC 15886 / NCIMB 8040 / NRRL B-1843 / 9) TaxID=1423757 RepID=C0XGG1_LENH9|nr:hypothetical protein [Lentilactobacillus hilgardii]EEI25505.1 hypothetical protein HMPREF0519_0322 [Lentilactobacillus hilgardii DSM 20176 = ATCC 8290]KRK56641.1 hypothetical protein FD42_GL000329 [Lentilactobacillus hilgardii DSM 20176 = ATCC 8290]QEU39472.1 hypothetical protein LH500_11680 [Lentilactobacillus hilgardii]TDG83791.1 hypothetical protein C5L34_000136 [Lentilactobacillus hilgardii]
MKNEEKKVIYWAVISLVFFLLVNWLMTLDFMRLDRRVLLSEAVRVTIIAGVFYLATILLAYLKMKISYYLMAVVVAIYTVGFVGMLATMFTGSSANIIVKLVMAALSAFGIIVNFYWFILAFKLRAIFQRESLEKRLNKNKQLKK